MKDKVKRRRIVNSKKIKDLLNDPRFTTQSHIDYELEKQKKIIDEQQADLDVIMTLELKIKLLKEKTKQLNKEFLLTKKQDYKTTKEFYQAYNQAKNKRKEVIKSYKIDLKRLKNEYVEKYELTSYKLKRWFFGMGKEFSRISWSSKKKIFINLIIVISISGFLATLFFLIDLIFGLF